jgi:hypothetical protein
MSYACPVCGYLGLDSPPHDDVGGASHEICPSCGFQFGYDDDVKGITYDQWRQDWIGRESPWSSRGISSPPGWNPAIQLRRIFTQTE